VIRSEAETQEFDCVPPGVLPGVPGDLDCLESKYRIVATGTVYSLADDPIGTFTMNERGTFYWPTWSGTNRGKLTIEGVKDNDGKVIVQFQGTTSFFTGVLGCWTSRSGGGSYFTSGGAPPHFEVTYVSGPCNEAS
jgi:hypothetical protein